jgi:hypothetical protein
MGAVEDAVRREVQGSSTLAELAYKLAREIDMDSGGVAAVRELRATLNAYRANRTIRPPFIPTIVDPPEQDEEEEKPLRDGRYFRNGRWLRIVDGEVVEEE